MAGRSNEVDGPSTETPCAMDAVERLHALPESEHADFLDSYCGADTGLRSEIIALFEGSRLVSGLLPSTDLDAGTLLSDGRYELCEELGQGGFASVWLARDRRLDKSVAIKLFDPDGSHITRLALFEARAASAVQSDHVRAVLDVSEDAEHGLSYIVMAPCRETGPAGPADATPLGQTTPRHRREALRWCRDVALGVQAVHEQGLFHGDLKPDNVLILPYSRQAQLIDFGAIGRFVASQAQSVGAGLCATPAYVAPEVACGELSSQVSPSLPDDLPKFVRMDVYGVGAILYEVLTGAAPYAPRPGAPDPVADVMEQVRRGPPPSVRGADRSESRYRVPARLARIVERAMHRSPAMRYPSCQALADDLTALIEGGTASVDGPADRALVWLRRHGMRLAMIHFALISAVAMLDAAQVRGEYQDLVTRTEKGRLQGIIDFLTGIAGTTIFGPQPSASSSPTAELARSGKQAGPESRGAKGRKPKQRKPPPTPPAPPIERNPDASDADLRGADGEPPGSASNPVADPIPVTPPLPPPTLQSPRERERRLEGAEQEAVVSRFIGDVRAVASTRRVLETRDSKRRLTHLWIEGTSLPSVRELPLTKEQRDRLEGILAKRHRRFQHRTDGHGRVTQDCSALNVSGSLADSDPFQCKRLKAPGRRPRGLRIVPMSRPR